MDFVSFKSNIKYYQEIKIHIQPHCDSNNNNYRWLSKVTFGSKISDQIFILVKSVSK